ncbi:MAG: AAA family ATPase [Patescibacteria group bacterium]|jgi:dephospho-CoA kinase|nr:AAA family ATPase [Patescibacteria group bacterium]
MKKIIIGLVGETGSGKDTVAKYLKGKYEATLMRFKDPMEETLSIFFEKPSKEDYQWFFKSLHERFGMDILCKGLKKKIDGSEAELIVVNGLRMPSDYDFIRSYSNSFILYVTADQKVRWQRVTVRGEKSDDDISFEKFQKLDKNETEVHIPEIGAKADYTIKNEQDLEHLLNETDKFLAEIKEEEDGLPEIKDEKEGESSSDKASADEEKIEGFERKEI